MGSKAADKKYRAMVKKRDPIRWRATKLRSTSKDYSIEEYVEIIKTAGPCIYCSVPLDWRNISLDHRVPTSRGGSNTKDNFQFVCKSCNRMKSSFMPDEYLKLLDVFPKGSEAFKLLMTKLKASNMMFGR